MWLLRSKSFLKLCQRTVFFVALFILVGIFLLQVTFATIFSPGCKIGARLRELMRERDVTVKTRQ